MTRRRQLRAELLEERRVMDASGLLDGNLFQNPVSNTNVNGDQVVTAIDALVVIPSNDAFLANLDSQAYRLFDDVGQFTGPITITLYGNDI